MVAVCNVRRQLRERHQLTRLQCARKDGLQMACEDGAGVLEVLFGVGFGGGDALKRLVEDADDPPLLGDRRQRDWKRREIPDRYAVYRGAANCFAVQELAEGRRDVLIQEELRVDMVLVEANQSHSSPQTAFETFWDDRCLPEPGFV